MRDLINDLKKGDRTVSSSEDKLNANALSLTTGLLLAFAITFFLYYGLNTMNDPVFGITAIGWG